ncbi:MAG: hypothetical protein D6708_16115 [Candidatus Dadabacteria bacterium]|nr:MAG: hypothetical protein D6708_16115 [Candidatus Dadabacteria bacterium]
MNPRVGGREAVEKALSARLGGPVRWVWTQNRRVYASVRRSAGEVTVRLHRSFRRAPPEVWEGLGRFLLDGDRTRLGPALEHFRRHRGEPRPKRVVVRPRGRAHDLAEILEELLRLPEFGGLPPVAVSWGRRRSPGRRVVRVGSYSPGPPAVIRVHPVLDRPGVPRAAVASVVHHELVHHLLHVRHGPAEGRRHGARFRAWEKTFPDHAEARAWFDREFPNLIAARQLGG